MTLPDAEGRKKAAEGKDPIQVEVKGVEKSYDGQKVLRGVTFDIHRGRILLDATVGELKRRYLRSRRVTLVTASEHLELPVATGVRLVSAVPHRTTVEIDAAGSADAAIGALVDVVLRQTTLRDLMIEDPPMDEIIRSIYRTADTDERDGEAA